jgi:Flp pilus assembly protein CpaB
VSRRRRALLFALGALLAAAAGAALAEGYGDGAVRGYGPLRPVVVLEAGLAAGQRIGPHELGAALAVRRVPVRFAPSGALAAPAEALGLAAKATLPAGSYLLAAQLGPPTARKARRRRLRGDRGPVEIAVSGAGALLATGRRATGSKVDVVVTGEPSGAGPGRTYVAAAGVPLLGLRPEAEGPGPGATAAAILGLTRRQALRLIGAESFARRITVLPRG